MTKARVNADNASADIQGVTAGTGISGGGTSGTVTITNDMATAIDAKGDLVVGTGADTYDNLAVGTNGETIVADSSTSTGLRYQANFSAGKNKIINGDFGIWQRGTSFASLAAGSYCADRFTEAHDGTGTVTVTQQTFTPGTAPVSGYEGTYFLRDTLNTVGTSTFIGVAQAIEDVRTFAGQTVTLSFYAKADSARTSIVYFAQQFGSGGSGTVFSSTPSITYSTSWQRFTFTIAIPSVSGKTIGAGSSLLLGIRSTATAGSVLDIWGVQVEAGSVATAFQTATGTIQGELAACQRYYSRVNGTTVGGATWINGHISGSSPAYAIACYQYPVEMRVAPTITQSGSVRVSSASTLNDFSTFAGGAATKSLRTLYTPTSVTNGYACHIDFLSTAYIEMSAEL